MKAKLIKVDTGWVLMVDNVMYATDNDKLSLKNCQAIERGYDLDELAWNQLGNGKSPAIGRYESFIRGFQKALELLGGKKYSEEDMKLFARNYYREIKENTSNLLWDDLADKCMKEHIQSLQQTEWDVEIEMEFNQTNHASSLELTGNNLMDVSILENYKPKLDTESCLILKRI